MALIKTITLINIYLANDYPTHPMFVMDVSLEVDVGKKDILITLEKQTTLIEKLKVKLEKVLI